MSKDLETKFWKALEDDVTVFLGCDGALPRPMAATVDGHTAPIWFFTSHDTDLGRTLKAGSKDGIMTFSSKGNDIWASASGKLAIDNDRAMIEKLWNPFVAAWYEEGKDDPALCLVRYDATDAQIWEDGSSIVAGVKSLLGQDPKEDFQDKTDHVRLND